MVATRPGWFKPMVGGRSWGMGLRILWYGSEILFLHRSVVKTLSFRVPSAFTEQQLIELGELRGLPEYSIDVVFRVLSIGDGFRTI